jgi:hypothetical protein
MAKARIPSARREVRPGVLAGLGDLDGEHGLVGLHLPQHGAELVQALRGRVRPGCGTRPSGQGLLNVPDGHEVLGLDLLAVDDLAVDGEHLDGGHVLRLDHGEPGLLRGEVLAHHVGGGAGEADARHENQTKTLLIVLPFLPLAQAATSLENVSLGELPPPTSGRPCPSRARCASDDARDTMPKMRVPPVRTTQSTVTAPSLVG